MNNPGRDSEVKYSVVLPVYNEAGNIEGVVGLAVATLEELKEPFEIVMVDDGSTDLGPRIMDRLAREDHRVRVLRFSRNFGQSAAIDAGFGAARGEVIITLDADLQNDPRDIPLLLGALGEADMATGMRRVRQDPSMKRISTRVANWVRNRVSGEDIADSACGFRVFRRECLKKIKLFDGMHRFLPTLFRLEGFEVKEVDVPHHPRVQGISKYSTRSRMFRAFADLLAVCWMKKRRLNYTIEKGPDDSQD